MNIRILCTSIFASVRQLERHRNPCTNGECFARDDNIVVKLILPLFRDCNRFVNLNVVVGRASDQQNVLGSSYPGFKRTMTVNGCLKIVMYRAKIGTLIDSGNDWGIGSSKVVVVIAGLKCPVALG